MLCKVYACQNILCLLLSGEPFSFLREIVASEFMKEQESFKRSFTSMFFSLIPVLNSYSYGLWSLINSSISRKLSLTHCYLVERKVCFEIKLKLRHFTFHIFQKSSAFLNWVSARFYETDCTIMLILLEF
jgi:hypothetical protein